ncbi:MAG: carboxypeptidase regulatory-like domain-containing protein, partial [Candidatus Cloacimonetes bacterium]|nr:carboxypeptidase regulatory-like domain-containing protein [Candidatus Cloacimonadota bacterium]
MIRKFFITAAFIFLLLSSLWSETIWSDDFEIISSWLLSGEFQMDAPQGLGGEHGNPDPSVAYGGTKVLGVDLTGSGSFPGDYENNLGNREYTAISPPIDCSSFLDVQLSFMRWLNVEQPAYDHAYIDVSNDDGTTWLEIWTNTSVITNNSWNQATYDISSIADLQSNVRIRFSIGSTDGSWQYSGWNIDDLLISGVEAVFGAIEGNIVDATNNDPISFAQVMSSFGNTISDEDGYFLLTDIPYGNQSISVTALGYLAYTQDNIMVLENDTTYVLCELVPDPDLPPEPQNLEAFVFNGNNVHLTWEEPNYTRDILLAYNVY